MQDCSTASTPMTTITKLDKDTGASLDITNYRGMIGSLLYLTVSRPDITYATCLCARFQADPREPHLIAVKRIFKYLKGTADLGLWYPRESNFKLIGYSDAYFARYKIDRKNTSGRCQFLGGRLVFWFSKKQKSISTLTAEAEHITAGSCCAQILWMKNQLLDYGLEFSKISIYCDNQSAITMAGTVELHFVPTDQQLADIFTKPLCEATFTRLVNKLGMVPGTQILEFWRSGVYNDGGLAGSPSIIFTIGEDEHLVTLSTVRHALHLPENCTFNAQIEEPLLQGMMANLVYEKGLSKMGQLKRPYIRKEWSYFFDCITRAFGNKCSNFDAIPILIPTINTQPAQSSQPQPTIRTYFQPAQSSQPQPSAPTVHASEPVIIEAGNVIFQKEVEAEESTLQKENEAEGSGIQKRKRSANSDADHVSPPTRRSKKKRTGRHMAQPQSEDAKEVEEGDQESLISSGPIVIEALPPPPQAEDSVQDTVITPPISPTKESVTVEESGLSPEIDIHRLNIPTVLYLEAPSKETTPSVSPLNAEVPNTPILDVKTDEVVPESPTATHTLVLSEDDEFLASSGESALVNTPAPILGKEELSKVLSDHIAKADELLTNSDFKAQLKVTALSTKSLKGQHSITHTKVDKLQENADKLDLMLKLDKYKFIRPIHEKVEAIEKVHEKQQAQLTDVLQNQASQQTQLNDIQSSVELLLSLHLPDDAKKGEKVVKSKCSTIQTLKKKDDKEDDQGNPSKGKGQGQGQSSKVSSKKLNPDSSKSSTKKNTSSEAVNAQTLKASSDNQSLISSSDLLIQGGSQHSQKFLQTLKLKGRDTTVYYKDPKIQTLDEEIARRLFLKHNPRMDLKTLKEEEARFAAEKTNLKCKASNAKKRPRPKEKGIVIKERSTSEPSKPKTRSQDEIDPKAKGKEKVFDDTAVEDGTIETLKRRKITEESKTTSDTAQVVQSEEHQTTEETTNHDQVINL
ncbi:hypothetical protein AgCh_009144 [Apium graveolens]